MTPTTMYISGLLRDWMFFLKLRGDPSSGTQDEHQFLAHQCSSVLMSVAPSMSEILTYE